MFIFIRLLLGHFIADFPLQFNKVYELKHRGLKGGIPHALIVVVSLLLVSWPYLNLLKLWAFIFFIGITHLFQDSIKVGYKELKYSFWFYLLDQLSHIVLIAAVFLTTLKDLPPPKYTPGFMTSVYNNNPLLIYLIAVIIATYNGYYMIRAFKNTFLGSVEKYSPLGKWYGMLERLVMVSLFFLGGFFFLLVPVALLIRPLIFYLGKNRFNLDKQFISVFELFLSGLVAILTGTGLYLIAQRL
jgi:hypothetical protein